jgi:hypothetical protein
MCSRSTSLRSSVCLGRAGSDGARLPALVRAPAAAPAVGSGGRCDREMQGIDLDDVTGARMTARWMMFSSSRTLPGQAWRCKRRSAARGRRKPGRPARAAVRGQEMARQRDDVLAALPQGRDQQRKDVEPIEQVFAKKTLRHRVGDVPIGGGDDADIEDHRLLAAHPLDFAFLENAQQLGLQAQAAFR